MEATQQQKKRKPSPAQRAAYLANAAKARAALAAKLKRGEKLGKSKKRKPGMAVTEIPIEAIGSMPVSRIRRAVKHVPGARASHDQQAVDALADLIVAVWASVQRRRGG